MCMGLILGRGLFLDVLVEKKLRAPVLIKMLFFFSEEVKGRTKASNEGALSLHVTPKYSQFGIQNF